MSDEVFYNTWGSFANADKSVISWEGSNYYRACDFPVVINDDGSGSHCVKRAEHPGDIHEDYDGVRTTTDRKGRYAIIVTVPMNEDPKTGFAEVTEVMQILKPVLGDKNGRQIYNAINDVADQIIMILEGDG